MSHTPKPQHTPESIINTLQEGIRIIKFTNMDAYGLFINQDAATFITKAENLIEVLKNEDQH